MSIAGGKRLRHGSQHRVKAREYKRGDGGGSPDLLLF